MATVVVTALLALFGRFTPINLTYCFNINLYSFTPYLRRRGAPAIPICALNGRVFIYEPHFNVIAVAFSIGVRHKLVSVLRPPKPLRNSPVYVIAFGRGRIRSCFVFVHCTG